jgi:ABC-2 type transport system ATP-binding protein
VSKNTILRAKGLSKSYNGVEALRDFSFEIGAGEIVGLLGPNGAGKTTAMRILSTIFPPDEGEFWLMDTPNMRAEEIRAKIGVLPESMGFPSYMSGEAYLSYIGKLYGKSAEEAKKKAEELLALFGLEDAGSKRIAAYSRGMRQRLGIARTFVHEPRLLLLDEPTLGFDPKGQREMLQVIRDAAELQGAAVLLCSHLLEVVDEICDRVLILNKGRLVSAGTVDEIKAKVPSAPICRIRVDAGVLSTALQTVASLSTVEAQANPKRDDEIQVAIPVQNGEATVNHILYSLIQANIKIESFNRESVRLSDAFLTMIEEAQA